MEALSLSAARRKLLRIALLCSAIIFALLLLQTLAGPKLEGQALQVWGWNVLLWLPLLLILIAMQWRPGPTRRADPLLFGLSRGLLWLYGLACLLVILLQPMAKIPLSELMSRAGFGLVPALAVLLGLLAAVFLKPSKSARETLDILPGEEKHRILSAFEAISEEVREDISDDKVVEALEKMQQFCTDHQLPKSELIALEQRWRKNEKLRMENTEDPAHLDRESNRITKALLQGIDELLAQVRS